MFYNRQVSNEFLVRRKIDIEYITAVHYLSEDRNEVEPILQDTCLYDKRREVGVITAMHNQRPDFDICINLGAQRVTIAKDELHYSDPATRSKIFFIDSSTNCICELRIKGNELIPADYDDDISIGEIVNGNTEASNAG